MHTDEYEISIAREIALCRKMLRKLQAALDKREQQCGMTTAALLESQAGEALAGQLPFKQWQQEYQELQRWQRRLAEYEAALESLKSH